MKKNMVPIVVLALTLSIVFAGVTMAADPGNSVSGTVKNVDVASSTLVVQ
ncbi:MAG TPA: hypothetical protein VJ044_19715 [Candidatus Hodarchaeales archaeon]|nr:hypothetical protein [Candidatus Hodarchaeales archaeon]